MAFLNSNLVAQLAQMFLVVLVAPLVTGVVRKVKARLLRRRGASVLQPYYDLWKLMRKETVPAPNASWLYHAAPYALFALTWVAAALVPTFATGLGFNWAADLIVIVGLLAAARFALALAGMDIGTGFGGLGASREMMISSFAEPAMLMVMFALALEAGTTQLSSIAGYLIAHPAALHISLALALVSYIIVLLAENARIPVDNPSTHLELTMVHEAMVLEYSGRHLAMIEAAAFLKLVLYMSIFSCLFVPFGMVTSDRTVATMAAGAALYVGKLLLGAAALAVGETSVAKMRVFRVGEFLGVGLVLGLLALLLHFVAAAGVN
ncbi:MAG: NADH-quinone oxidoreductase subunit H [Alphaproteobacteria bacterium]|nr:NADH-quinone oxidoreductase subunit H [Alphaproteobacteria bacterium]